MPNPKLLSQVVIDSTRQTFAVTVDGADLTVDLTAATYATMIEVCIELQGQLRGITPNFSVAISSAGIVTVTNATNTWSVRWGATDSELATLLGFRRTEAVAAGVLTSTKRHSAAWYSPVGVQFDPDRRRKTTRRQDIDDGDMSAYSSDAIHRERELLFECLTEAQVEGGATEDGIDWRDRSLADFWEYTMAKPFRIYVDPTDGTVADPGVEAGNYSRPMAGEYVTCRISDDRLRPRLRDPGDYSLIDCRMAVKVTGRRTSTTEIRELWNLPMDYVGGCPGVDAKGWPSGSMYDSNCALDWQDGDGETPTVGPSLSETGDPTANKKTPWVTSAGAEITATHFDGNDQYTTSTAIDPASGEDIVVIALCRPEEPTNTLTIVSTRDSGRGWRLARRPGSSRYEIFVSGDTAVTVQSAYGSTHYGWSVVVAVIDRDGDTEIYVNGIASGAATSSPAGAIATGDGVGIGSIPGGSLDFEGDIARVQAYYGAGLADIWDATYVQRITASILGYVGTDGQAPSCARDSYQIGYVQHGSVEHVHVMAHDAPVAGNVRGLLAFEELTNKAYNNAHISAGDESVLTASGGTADTMDDETNIDAAGLREIGFEVYTLDNSSGSTQYVRCGAVTGNTNQVALSVRGNYEAGSGAELGLYDGSTWTKAADVADGYARSSGVVTPANASQAWALMIPDGCDLSFILQCHYEWPSSYVPPETINQNNSATDTQAATALTLPSAVATEFTSTSPRRLDATVLPEGWSAGEDGYTHRVVNRSTTEARYMRIDDTNGKVEVGDGTTTAEASITFASRAASQLRTEWGTGPSGDEMSAAEVGGSDGVAAYDGTIGGTGNHIIKDVDCWVRDVVLSEKQAA